MKTLLITLYHLSRRLTNVTQLRTIKAITMKLTQVIA